jgi:hypothetical protein
MSLLDYSPTLQQLYEYRPDQEGTSDKEKQPVKEKSISQIKHEVQKLEDWSKGHDEVFQQRQSCFHHHPARRSKAEPDLKIFCLTDQRTLFVGNGFLWVNYRPQKF